MEFYYQDILRWSYGFENPNKAAALIASLLPFFFLFFNAESRRARSFLIGFGVLLFLAGWFLLVRTYSRGGMVAALVSQGYMAWRFRRQLMMRWRLAAVVLVALMVMLVVSGLGARQAEVLAGDASVTNRLTLWKGGLEMLAEVPGGVGTGNSGRFYMEWYQPLIAKEGYRTLVNSYLTFAVEQGLWMFGACLALAMAFWGIAVHAKTRRREDSFFENIRIVASGSLLAFLVAGFFSTTMESPLLWISPLASVFLLVWVGWRSVCWDGAVLRPVIFGMALALLAIVACHMAGRWVMSQDKMGRSFVFQQGRLSRVVLWEKGTKADDEWTLRMDEEVLGRDYGKLLRTMLDRSLTTKLTVLCDSEGSRGVKLSQGKGRQVWIMPELRDVAVKDGERVVLSNRVAERLPEEISQSLMARNGLLVLGGAERNVAWYWDEILDWLGK